MTRNQHTGIDTVLPESSWNKQDAESLRTNGWGYRGGANEWGYREGQIEHSYGAN